MRLPTLSSLRLQTGWQRLRALLCVNVMATVLIIACAMPGGPAGWQQAHGPVVPHDSFPADCSLCHTTGSWTEMRSDFQFDHLAETGVPLNGAHSDAECLRCHNDRGPVARFASRGCVGCHGDQHLGSLGPRCEACHSESDWRPVGAVAEHAATRFPLVGSHATTACQECHPGGESGVYSPTPTQCESCHQPQLVQATNPNHVALGWTADCQRCHKPTSWDGSGFVHSAWPLTGAHTTADCEACHVGGVFQGTPRDCWSCHAAEYQATTDPNHVAKGFPMDCSQCHSTRSWEGGEFSHAGITSGCVNCHLPEYQATTDPNHVANNFPVSCELCHNTENWDDGDFDHVGVTSGCLNCHLPLYQATTNPNHVANNFPTSCQQCHGTITWQGASFNHAGISSNCVSCHLPEYQATTDPNHAALGVPTSCEQCHISTNNWETTNFVHVFLLNSGPHANVSCLTCHPGGVTSQPNCLQCHGQQQTGKDHSEVTGYVWSSPACITCHPQGINNR